MDILMEEINYKKRVNPPKKVKEALLKKQSNKCANNPDIPAIETKGYMCPLCGCYMLEILMKLEQNMIM